MSVKSTSCTVNKTILNSIHVNIRSKYMVSLKISIYQLMTWSLSLASDVPIAKEETDISHKLYNGKNHPKSIIVKFINYKKKAQLYRKRTEVKNVKISELFSTFSGADVAQSTRIFINENLTHYRRKIMKKANQMKREGTIQSAWSLDGKLYVKTSPSGTPTRIYCEEDLNNL